MFCEPALGFRQDPHRMARENEQVKIGVRRRVPTRSRPQPRRLSAAARGGEHRHTLRGHHQIRRAAVGGSDPQHAGLQEDDGPLP